VASRPDSQFLAVACALLLAPLAWAAPEADRGVYQGARVANFAPVGGTGERLSFWSGPQGTLIELAEGQSEPVRLRYLGRIKGGFALRRPDGAVLDVRPDGEGLRVRDRAGEHERIFKWLYEGPIGGRGTACMPCVPEEDAAAFVREHFMR
jgi:hypothetical protein